MTVPITPTEFASVVTAITSAFGDPTRREIYMYLHEQADGVTAAGVAAHFDLHPNVARHHLDKLASGGYVEISTGRPAGSAGRPSKRYRAARPEMALDVPVRHDDVLVELLGRTLAELGPQRSAELAEEVGVEYGRKMAQSMGEHSTNSFRSALHTVADALSAHGFAAQTKDDGNRLRIVTEHCPFGDAAGEHPVICAVDRGMVKGMLGELYHETSVDLVSSYVSGDDYCVTAVSEAGGPTADGRDTAESRDTAAPGTGVPEAQPARPT